eukprot:3651781-Amphidinium_carterae.1
MHKTPKTNLLLWFGITNKNHKGLSLYRNPRKMIPKRFDSEKREPTVHKVLLSVFPQVTRVALADESFGGLVPACLHGCRCVRAAGLVRS